MASIRKVRKAYKRKVGIKQIWIRIKCKKTEFRLSRSHHKLLRRWVKERMRISLLSRHVHR